MGIPFFHVVADRMSEGRWEIPCGSGYKTRERSRKREKDQKNNFCDRCSLGALPSGCPEGLGIAWGLPGGCLRPLTGCQLCCSACRVVAFYRGACSVLALATVCPKKKKSKRKKQIVLSSGCFPPLPARRMKMIADIGNFRRSL